MTPFLINDTVLDRWHHCWHCLWSMTPLLTLSNSSFFMKFLVFPCFKGNGGPGQCTRVPGMVRTVHHPTHYPGYYHHPYCTRHGYWRPVQHRSVVSVSSPGSFWLQHMGLINRLFYEPLKIMKITVFPEIPCLNPAVSQYFLTFRDFQCFYDKTVILWQNCDFLTKRGSID